MRDLCFVDTEAGEIYRDHIMRTTREDVGYRCSLALLECRLDQCLKRLRLSVIHKGHLDGVSFFNREVWRSYVDRVDDLVGTVLAALLLLVVEVVNEE